MAGNSVRNTKAPSLLYAIILAIIFIVLFGAFIYLLQEHTTLPVEMVDRWYVFLIVSLVVSIFAGLLMASVAKRNFGMVNGDVLGATNEITRVMVYMSFIILTYLVYVW
jgi:cobalamin synthase